jgi:hypothetical protein
LEVNFGVGCNERLEKEEEEEIKESQLIKMLVLRSLKDPLVNGRFANPH